MRTSWILIGAAAITLVLASGCQTTHEIGKSSAQLFRGETGATVDQSPDVISKAIDLAIGDLKLIRINATTRPSENHVETIVVARNSDDTRIQIAYVPVDGKKTRVVVSTGAFGDSDLRDKVWDAVRIRIATVGENARALSLEEGSSRYRDAFQAFARESGARPAASKARVAARKPARFTSPPRFFHWLRWTKRTMVHGRERDPSGRGCARAHGANGAASAGATRAFPPRHR